MSTQMQSEALAPLRQHLAEAFTQRETTKLEATFSKLCTLKEFKERYHESVVMPTIHYWAERGEIDVVKIGRLRLVVLTEKTLAKQPNAYGGKRDKE
jgi:hypothetical protein